jgi:hypothetical protein
MALLLWPRLRFSCATSLYRLAVLSSRHGHGADSPRTSSPRSTPRCGADAVLNFGANKKAAPGRPPKLAWQRDADDGRADGKRSSKTWRRPASPRMPPRTPCKPPNAWRASGGGACASHSRRTHHPRRKPLARSPSRTHRAPAPSRAASVQLSPTTRHTTRCSRTIVAVALCPNGIHLMYVVERRPPSILG